MHSLRAVPLLLLTVLAKAEFLSPFHPVIDLNPACPELRHYYRRLPAGPGSAAGMAVEGKCHRCYCKAEVNGTAACWPRADKRCDDVGRKEQGVRVRRSLLGLTDLIFGSKASKFFKEELPKECVPKTSFSDGCPPADWCMGCTVCDCDSNGRWECHILSFCSGNESKKRINGSKVPVPKSIRTRNQKQTRKKQTTKAVTKKATKSRTKKTPPTTKKPNKQTKKILRSKPKDQKKNQTKPTPKKVVVKKAKKIIFKPKPTTKRPKPTKKPTNKIKPTKKPKSTKRTKPPKKPKPTQPIKKTKPTKKPKTTESPKRYNENIKQTLESISEESIEQTTLNPTSKNKRSKTQIRKVVRRVLSKRESKPNINETSDVKSGESLEQTVMGRKLVKKVLATIDKLMAKQVAMIQNKTNILRSQYEDCPKVKAIEKKKKKKIEKPKRKTRKQMTIEEIREKKMEAYINRNSWRVKRDAFDIVQLTTPNNNESKMYDDVTDADVKFLVKELEKPSTALKGVSDDVTSRTLSKVSDTSEIGYDVLKSTGRATGTTDIITSSDTAQVLNSTESNFKYYEYLPDNTNKTTHTVNIFANYGHTKSNTTELKSQNDLPNKLIDYTTQNILTEDPNIKSLLILDKNEKVKNFTIFNTKNILSNNKDMPLLKLDKNGTFENVTIYKTKNILSNSIDRPNEYTYYTSQITTDNSKTVIGFSSKIVADEIKIIQPQNENSKFKQRNKKTTKSTGGKKYDVIINKRLKTNKINKNNNRYKSYNVTTPNRKRVSNLSINDADLIKLIKNKIKNRNEKNKFASDPKNITKKGKTIYAPSASSSNHNNLTSNAKNNNTIEKKGSLQRLLERLMVQKKDSVTQSEKKPKSSVFKYLRNIFKKIFSHKRDNHTTHKTNEGYTLEVLCDNVGACFKNEHMKVALRSKLHDLNSETEKVFKTIKLIKSLLHFIDIPTNVTYDSTEKTLNNDIKKLNAILKGTYYETNEITAREKSQIRVVKENIHNFIVSVGKFASILHEVLGELYKNNKKYACQQNLRLNRKVNSQKTLNKIKKLLKNYNVVQNTFMKRIFQLIKNAENNTSSESTLKFINNDNSLNDTPIVDTYTTNIIENLRKLKNLAQAFNSTRRKRWISRNDDAMEFMLLMLEYLLKKNQPLETHPANDGIDLLIEAMQNAPSIKSIKSAPSVTSTQEKNLNFNYTKWHETIPTRSKDPGLLTDTRTTLAAPIKTDFKTSEPVKRNSVERESDENFAINYENSVSGDENVLGDRATIDLDEEKKEKVYQRGMERSDNRSIPIDFPEFPEENISQNDSVEQVEPPKSVSNLTVKKPDNDTITSDEEENNSNEAGIAVAVTDAPVQANNETVVAWEDFKLDLIPVTNKEINFDWIEENFGKEINAYKSAELFTMKPVSVQTVSTLLTTNTTTTTTMATTTTVVPDKRIDDISGLSDEIVDEKKPKVVTDLILQRKEMDLLNSLDYGTELPDFDDSISKEEVRRE